MDKVNPFNHLHESLITKNWYRIRYQPTERASLVAREKYEPIHVKELPDLKPNLSFNHCRVAINFEIDFGLLNDRFLGELIQFIADRFGNARLLGDGPLRRGTPGAYRWGNSQIAVVGNWVAVFWIICNRRYQGTKKDIKVGHLKPSLYG